MEIEFDSELHSYFVDGNIAGISVTQLLKNHNLSPSYAEVPQDVLQKASKKGTAIHKDIELALTHATYEPKTNECKEFMQWAKENLDCATPEVMIAINYNGLIVAGTPDVLAITKEGDLCIIDHKTTSAVYRKSISWQISIYDYMLRHAKEPINNVDYKIWNNGKNHKYYCSHFHDGIMTMIEIEKINDNQIEELLYCELNDKIYREEDKELCVSDDFKEKFLQSAENFFKLETIYKKAEMEYKKQVAKLLAVFEEQGIKKYEDDYVSITYKEPYERNTVNSDMLKKEYPTIYMKAIKKTKVKGSLLIKQKEN